MSEKEDPLGWLEEFGRDVDNLTPKERLAASRAIRIIGGRKAAIRALRLVEDKPLPRSGPKAHDVPLRMRMPDGGAIQAATRIVRMDSTGTLPDKFDFVTLSHGNGQMTAEKDLSRRIGDSVLTWAQREMDDQFREAMERIEDSE